MSHWVKRTAKVLDDVKPSLLTKACAELGVSFDTNIKNIGNAYGENGNVDAAIVKDGRAMPIGFSFKQQDGKTKLVLEGDFWRTGFNETDFINKLSQSYQKHNIIEQAQGQGWFFDKNEVNEKGEVVLEAYQWA